MSSVFLNFFFVSHLASERSGCKLSRWLESGEFDVSAIIKIISIILLSFGLPVNFRYTKVQSYCGVTGATSTSLPWSCHTEVNVSGFTAEVQKHPALALENFVGQFDDESIGEDQVAQGLDMEQVFHLHARRGVLAENGVGSGRGT